MRSLFLLALLAVTGMASAEVYKWVDANGKVTYSDQRPPSNVTGQKLGAPPPPADPDAAKRLATQQAELKKAADAEAEKRKKSDQAATLARMKDENCAQNRGRLQELRSGVVVYRYNERGEREYVDDAGRDQALKEMEDYIAKSCGS